MKKRILSAFLVLCMMLTMVPTAALAAEDPGGGNGSDRVHTESNDGVVVDKTVNYDEDGNYSLTLEAYVTNEVTKGSKTTPLDIVLVLDVSGSMDDDLGESTWEYTPTDEQRWSYSDINGSRWTTYYFRDDDGNYYEVPNNPWCWMNNPPTVNQLMGMQWLPRLLYPNAFDDSIEDVTRDYYKTMYNYDLSDAEMSELLTGALPK